MKSTVFAAAALSALVALTGCTSTSLDGSSYTRSSARYAQTVRFGTIALIEEVTIENEGGGAMGGIGGAVLGAAIGSTMGGGSGHMVGAAAGGVGGALLGSAVGDKVTKRKALEITVQYQDANQVEVIVQEPGKDQFFVGQSVRVLTEADGTKRVRPLPVAPAYPAYPAAPAQ